MKINMDPESTAYGLLPPEVRDPRLLMNNNSITLANVGEHWQDFNRRDYSWASKGLLVVAVLQVMGVVIYDVVLAESSCSEFEMGCTPAGKERTNYISYSLIIIELFQSYLCVTGVIFENLPMLIFANVNAAVVVGRMYLNDQNSTTALLRYVPVSGSGALSGITIIFSLFAGWKFGRLVCFTISGDEAIIKLYGHYQLVQAVLVLDTQCAAITMVTSFQFADTLGNWDTVIAIALCVVVAVVNISILYHVRLEHKRSIIIFLVVSASFLVYAVYSSSELITTKGEDYAASKSLAMLSLISMFVSRIIMFAAVIYGMVMNYGQGLKECLKNEKKNVKGVLSASKEKLFLAEDEEPPRRDSLSTSQQGSTTFSVPNGSKEF